MINTLFSILPIFLLIASGFLLKRKIAPDETFWKMVEKLTYYVFFPCLLILKIGEADFTSINSSGALAAVVGATFITAAVVFASKWLWKVDNPVFTSIFQGGVRYNSYVFIVLSQSLYGQEGVAVSGIFVAYMIVLTNVLSVAVMNHFGSTGKKSIWGALSALLKNPLIIGAAIGLALNYGHVRVTGVLFAYMHYLADAATPLSLLAVGAGLSLVMHWRRIAATAYASGLKLVFMPIATALLLKAFGVAGLPAGIALLYSAVPTAGNAYILARQMGGDAEVMASIITWSTLLSAVTITIIFGLVPH